MKKITLLGIILTLANIANANEVVTTYDNSAYDKKESVVYYDNSQTTTKKSSQDLKKKKIYNK
jgi:hypothetical protein